MSLYSWCCVDCAGILRELNAPVKSLTSSTFSQEELLKLQSFNPAYGDSVIMGNYNPKGKYPLPSQKSSSKYRRSFLYAKYGKKKWYKPENKASETGSALSEWSEFQSSVVDKDFELLSPASPSPPSTTGPTTSNIIPNISNASNSANATSSSFEDFINFSQEQEVASMKNPNQLNIFGSYKNIHTSAAPDRLMDDLFSTFKIEGATVSAPALKSLNNPLPAFSTDTIVPGKLTTPSSPLRNNGNGLYAKSLLEPIQIQVGDSDVKNNDPYAAFSATSFDNSSSIFNSFPSSSSSTLKENSSTAAVVDPYSAFRTDVKVNTSTVKSTSIWDSASTLSSQKTHPLTMPPILISQNTFSDDEFGEFKSASTSSLVKPSQPKSENTSSNLLNASFDDLLKF